MGRRSALKSMNINNLLQLIYVIEFKFTFNARTMLQNMLSATITDKSSWEGGIT